MAAAVTLVAGIVLERTGERIASHVGLSGVIFGATILAAATALPEVSTGIASVKLGDYQLAVSDIFGGNAFLPGAVPAGERALRTDRVTSAYSPRAGESRYFGGVAPRAQSRRARRRTLRG
jgi:Sodium/calcium exchanger protein